MSENDTATARAGEGEPGMVRYVLDKGRSTFTVHATAGGLLAGLGHNPTIAIRDFTAETSFEPDTFATASVRVVVRARSLEVTDEMKEKDRREITHTMFDEVLEVAAYPEIVFESTNIMVSHAGEARYKARIIGDLTLHGVKRTGLWIPAQVHLAGDDLHARGEFTLKQTDYKIKLVSVAGGVLKLKDELKFAFDLVGTRVPAGG